MTCIVGIETDKAAYIGGDSAGVAGMDITIRADTKVFRVGEMIIGYTSSFRMGQLLRYKLALPPQKVDQDDFAYLCTDFVDAVIDTLEKNGYSKVKDNEKEGGSFIVAFNHKIYKIESDFQVGRAVNGYASVGCGAPFAMGAISALRTITTNPEDLMQRALHAAEENSAGVVGPFVLMNTLRP
jgi:ATP-dependent protease HslVU (ClpYQ) peptidase subunit